MASQREVEDQAGGCAGERKYGRTVNVPANRPQKPTDEMGPHNFGGGEAGPRRAAMAAGRSTAGKGGTRVYKGKRRG